MTELTKEHIERLITYNPITGRFLWRVISGRRGKDRATRPNAEGYNYLHLNGKEYRASRVAWLLVTGEWPKGQIDHRNGNPADDRFRNLRECTQSQNKSNSRIYKNNKTGFKGVTFDHTRDRPSKYRASISKDGKVHRIGWYETAEEAAAARARALGRYHGEFAREK